jgi:hypothetical protein
MHAGTVDGAKNIRLDFVELSPGSLSTPMQIYQIKITLCGWRPPNWRRIQVRSDITIAKLHSVLQAVVGWTDMPLAR